MNYKTTLALLIVVVVGMGTFLIWNPEPPAADTGNVEPQTTRDLFDPKPDTEIVRMELERPGKEKFVFTRAEKQDAPGEYEDWRLAEPVAGKAVNWTVKSFAEKVRDLKYRDRDSTITDETAGLGADKATTITITDAKDKAFSVAIGRSVGDENTFVRKSDDQAVYIVSAKFDDDLKKKLDDYRDKDLLELTSADAREITIVHEQKRYHVTKNDAGDWVFDSPFIGYGDNTKIKSLADDLNYLRADEFIETRPADLKPFGLDTPHLRVEVTTVKETTPPTPDTQPADGEDETETPEPQVERKTFAVEFGGWAGFDKTKAFAKVVGQPSVVTVSKYNYEKFLAKPNEWREMKITRAAVRTATKVELNVGGQSETLAKELGQWRIAGESADAAAVDDLLKAIADLKATQYREADDPEASSFGLDSPRATLTLTLPGQTDPEVITIGGTSPSGRMAYVRRGATGSIGVVKADEIAAFVRPPVAYRDRKILSFARNRTSRIELTRKDDGTGGPIAFTLVKDDGLWTLTEPIRGKAEPQPVLDVLADLSSLSAKAVVGQGDGADFGLGDPQVRLKVTVDAPPAPPPPPTTQPATTQPASTQSAGTQPAATQPAPAPAPADPTLHELLVTKQGDKVYARLPDGDLIYEIDPVIHEHLTGEFLDRAVVTVSSSQLTGLRIDKGGKPQHDFVKKDEAWTYRTDRDVEIDETKVKEIVEKAPGLRAMRFVDYAASDLSRYNLADPDTTLTITRDDGDPIVLDIAATGPDGSDGRYATIRGSNRVFLLNNEDVDSFDKTVTDFEK